MKYFVILLFVSWTTLNAQNVGVNTPVPMSILDVDGDLALRVTSLVCINGDNHDVDISTIKKSIYKISGPVAAFSVTGLSGGVDGRIITLMNDSGFEMGIKNQDAGSTAANRIITGTSNEIVVPAQSLISFVYDLVLTRWRVTSVSSSSAGDGAWQISGNAGTTSGHFIGTTDAQPLRFRVDDTHAGAISLNTNVSLGLHALENNTSGTANTAYGEYSLFSNTTGVGNTAVGNVSLANNTTGIENIGVGNGALFYNTTGYNNTAIGTSALYNNTIGHNNIAIGYNPLVSNTTGHSNIATGYQALFDNTTGEFNMATGVSSLENNTTGSYNFAYGPYSLFFQYNRYY
ncbi:MAG: hypothetical protein IPG18_02210 [Saprospiraceae bacterium]|nr:hypothetical protein [Saprospiraceae bacterium]